MTKKHLACALLLLAGLGATMTFAAAADEKPQVALRAAGAFGDEMVLQREMPVPVWGTAAPGAKVEVDFAGQHKTARCDSSGRWEVKLNRMKASAENKTMTITCGAEKIEFKDVLVGEVWICSGQSNMEFGMGMCQNAQKEIAESTDSQLRLHLVTRALSSVPLTELKAAPWRTCDPAALRAGGWGGFSAVAYFFGRDLRRELKVPVGLIESSWGGTLIEPWTNPAGIAMTPSVTNAPASRIPHGNITGWSSLYNAMIHPLVPFAIRGAIWYQGESNLMMGDTTIYAEKMKALIGGWRKVWDEGDFPFFFVQIAPYNYPPESASLPYFWEAQTAAMREIPDTGMACINDIGMFGNIHPTDKQDVGHRLALWALAKTYDVREPEYCGPLFKKYSVDGGAIKVTFDHAGAGLKSRDGKPFDSFEIAGDSGEFVSADAKADGDTVTVSSPQVPHPLLVRFAWKECVAPNLVNSEGMPATSFSAPHDLALDAPYVCSNPNTHNYGKGGLTDGSWTPDAKHCFASNEDDSFPKDVTVDLGKPQRIDMVRFGVPPFGSTKTVVVEVSKDGKEFSEIGRHEFSQKKAETFLLQFPHAKERFVRLVYPDHYAEVVQYPAGFVFTTDLEVFGD